MRSPRTTTIGALLALALLVAGCGGDADDDAGSADTTATTEAGSTTTEAPADEPEASTTTTAATTTSESATTTEDEAERDDGADVVIVGAFRDGELEIEDRRFDVELGSTVRIEFTSDEVEHVHLHGYDILADVGPDLPVEMVFVADSPGAFEVELENSGRFLFEILVR